MEGTNFITCCVLQIVHYKLCITIAYIISCVKGVSSFSEWMEPQINKVLPVSFKVWCIDTCTDNHFELFHAVNTCALYLVIMLYSDNL